MPFAGARVGLVGAALCLGMFVPSAHAITYFYRATLHATGGETWSYPPYSSEQSTLIDDFSGSGSSSWQSSWTLGIRVDPTARTAGLDSGGFGSTASLTGTATGSWSGHGAYRNDPNQTPTPFSCSYSATSAQYRIPITVRLLGSGLDLGQPTGNASFATSGMFGFAIAGGGAQGPAPVCSGPAYPDSVISNGLPSSLFQGTEACQLGPGPNSVTPTPLKFPAAELGHGRIDVTGTFGNSDLSTSCPSLTGNARAGTTEAHVSNNVTYHLQLSAFCPAKVAQPSRGLGDDYPLERRWDDERATLLVLIKHIRTAIGTGGLDERRHPDNLARDKRLLRKLKAYLKGLVADYRAIPAQAGEQIPNPLGRIADTNADAALLREASCGLLDQAKGSLDSFVEEHGSKNKKDALDFIDKLVDFKKVLSGELKPNDTKKLLRSNMIALVERLGGGKPGVLAGKALTLYDVLAGNLTDKQLKATLQTQVGELANKVAGKNGALLAQQLFVLRDVLSGDQDPDKQFQVLKESVLGLATRFLAEDVLKIPQIRAAMLGFDLGRPFGERLAADLRLIQQTVLARECMLVLSRAQQVNGPADIDYSKRTETFITEKQIPGTHYDGWICKIHPEASVEGDRGGLVEAIEPVKFFGLLGGNSIYFDPAYSYGF
jgi:hypothetical protein